MRHNKIIFLDVDGVINIPPYLRFDEKCLDNLRNMVKKTGAKIVVSSSWRCGKMQDTINSLVDGGFPDDLIPYIIGETVRKWDFTKEGSFLKVVRGNEIGTWVDRNLKYPWHDNPEVDKDYRVLNDDGSFQRMNSNIVGKDYVYVILDDDTDMLLCQQKYFIHTDHILGLSEQDTEKAISILNSIDVKIETTIDESAVSKTNLRTREGTNE